MLKDRMPPISENDLTGEQKKSIEALVSGPRGGMRGPFISMLRSPEFMNRAQLLGEYLRYDSAVDKPLREFAILIAARIWQQTYEWHVHAVIAEKEGVNVDWIRQLETTGSVQGLSEDYQIIYDFCRELHLQHCVSDKTYSAALILLGEGGIVDLCGICGYYAMLAMLLNVGQTPVPNGSQYAFSLPGKTG